MLHKWKCPHCGQVVTEYAIICMNCGGERGFIRWLFNIDNPFLWVVVGLVACVGIVGFLI